MPETCAGQWRWDGVPVEKIAAQQRVNRDTIRNWVKRFNKEGIAGLYDRTKSGRHRKVAYDQIYQDILRSPEEFGYKVQGWNYKVVLDHIRRVYGIEYHRGSLSYILRSLKLRAITPRPRSYQTSEEKIETWKKKLGTPSAKRKTISG